MDYGAKGDGRILDTTAIQKTIDTAEAAKGGRVVFPPGTFLSGSIDYAHYQRLNFLALVMATEAENVGISGKGIENVRRAARMRTLLPPCGRADL